MFLSYCLRDTWYQRCLAEKVLVFLPMLGGRYRCEYYISVAWGQSQALGRGLQEDDNVSCLQYDQTLDINN